MPSFDVFAILGLVLVVILLAVIFLLPSESGSRRGIRRKGKAEEPIDTKDWKEACLKLEKHIHTLRAEIEQGKAREKNLERDVLVQKEKIKKLQEKISQERGWKQKEDSDTERRAQELVKLKSSLRHAEEEAHKEHGELLRLERENKEAKAAVASATEARRLLESQLMKVSAQLDAAQQQISGLRDDNAKLSKQQDETTWVSKTEYMKVEQQLRNLEKDLERFRSQVKKESA